jgi:hypothetical protein
VEPIFAAAARVAIDLELFHLIAEFKSGDTVAKLTEASGCSETLLVRLLRPLAALHFFRDVGENEWVATGLQTERTVGIDSYRMLMTLADQYFNCG